MSWRTRKRGTSRQRGTRFKTERSKLTLRKLKLPSQNRSTILAELKERAHREGLPTKHEDTYNGYTNWDTWELLLILENDQETYKWLGAWHDNFMRKIKEGRFDIAKAESVVANYLIPVARGKVRRMWFKDLAIDDQIDPKKVNKPEVVMHLLTHDA